MPSIVLPSKALPPQFHSHFDANTMKARFIVGFRNVLIRMEGILKWALIKDSNYCGLGFEYESPLMTEEELSKLGTFKDELNHLERYNDRFVMVSNKVQFGEVGTLSPQQIDSLLHELDGNTKVNLNVLKNAFSSYSNCRKALGEFAMKENPVQVYKGSIDLQGEKLLSVPKCNMKTGDIEKELIRLKIAP